MKAGESDIKFHQPCQGLYSQVIVAVLMCKVLRLCTLYKMWIGS
jgi:hypothetical protein